MKKCLISGLLIGLIGFFIWNSYDLFFITINNGPFAALYIKIVMLSIISFVILVLASNLYFSISEKKLIYNDIAFFRYGAILVLSMITLGSTYYGIKGNLFLLVASGFFLYLIFNLYKKTIKLETIDKYRSNDKELTPVVNEYYSSNAGNKARTINDRVSAATADDILDEIFTAESICSKCSGQLEIFGKDGIKIATCKKCGMAFTNVIPTTDGFKKISGLREFKDILP